MSLLGSPITPRVTSRVTSRVTPRVTQRVPARVPAREASPAISLTSPSASSCDAARTSGRDTSGSAGPARARLRAQVAAPQRDELEAAFFAWTLDPAKPDTVVISAERQLSMVELLHRLGGSRTALNGPEAATVGLDAGATLAEAAALLLHATVAPDGPRCRSFRASSYFLSGLSRLDDDLLVTHVCPEAQARDRSCGAPVGELNGDQPADSATPRSPRITPCSDRHHLEPRSSHEHHRLDHPHRRPDGRLRRLRIQPSPLTTTFPPLHPADTLQIRFPRPSEPPMSHVPRHPKVRTLFATLNHSMLVVVTVVLTLVTGSTAAHADVMLRTTESFAILAGQSVTNTGSTSITGDIGIHPGAAEEEEGNLTGGDSITLIDTLHDTDAVALQAKTDLVEAYDEAAGRDVTETLLLPDLDGMDLGPGVYESPGPGALSIAVGGTLTLRGDANAVWIFQSASSLILNTGSTVELAGGADPCNVYWQVTSDMSIGSDANIVGTIMAMGSITLGADAELQGRALARTGSVTLISNTISNAACGAASGSGDDAQRQTQQSTTEPTPEPQVTQPPTGPVAAGGDQAIATTGGWGTGLLAPFTFALALLVVGGTVGVVIRRRARR
jgi:hypothetical protein